MCRTYKVFGFLLAILLCTMITFHAFAQSSKVVSNVIIVKPPSNSGVAETPAPTEEPDVTQEPVPTGEPAVAQEPEETEPIEEPKGMEEPEEPEAPATTEGPGEPATTEEPEPTQEPVAPVMIIDFPEGASIEVIATIRQQGEVPAYGDSVVLRSILTGLDGYTVALQWQQLKDNQWIDLAGATEESLTFVMTKENAHDSWRVTATVYGNLVSQVPQGDMPSEEAAVPNTEQAG